ncbi:hypothetical protein ABZ953_32610 [Streptomyces sp. NPDC046465]|uniref:hypothetical protein n=1 Tax=Streptomyces sp. NPDC046465 TaxID=3155810 RepID=UPI0033CD8BD5
MFGTAVLLLAVGCFGGDGDSGSGREPSRKDDPNLLQGFRTWLKANDSKGDDALAGHALNVSLDYRSGERAGVVKVLTDYGPWGEAEDHVGPLAKAFTQWWDGDPAAGSAHFLGQGGKTAKKTTLYDGDKPSNLLADFRSWTADRSPAGKRLAPHVTGLTIGYGAKGSGAVTVSTDYRTHKDDTHKDDTPKDETDKGNGTQKNVDALGTAFADWWDGDEGAETVTVTSEDQGSSARRKLASPRSG